MKKTGKGTTAACSAKKARPPAATSSARCCARHGNRCTGLSPRAHAPATPSTPDGTRNIFSAWASTGSPSSCRPASESRDTHRTKSPSPNARTSREPSPRDTRCTPHPSVQRQDARRRPPDRRHQQRAARLRECRSWSSWRPAILVGSQPAFTTKNQLLWWRCRIRRRCWRSFLPIDQRIIAIPRTLHQIGPHFDFLTGHWTNLRLKCLISRQRDLDRMLPWSNQQSSPQSLKFGHMSHEQSVNKHGRPRRIHHDLHLRCHGGHDPGRTLLHGDPNHTFLTRLDFDAHHEITITILAHRDHVFPGKQQHLLRSLQLLQVSHILSVDPHAGRLLHFRLSQELDLSHYLISRIDRGRDQKSGNRQQQPRTQCHRYFWLWPDRGRGTH